MTETTTKANERSKPTLEDHYDMGGDDDEFDKLMGNLEKNEGTTGGAKKDTSAYKPSKAALMPPVSGATTIVVGHLKRSNEEPPLIQDEYEDFF
jgi:hypothetical protein